jgi:heme exporter protein C
MKSNAVLNTGYKVLAVLLVLYALIYGLTAQVPELPNLQQSARNIFYHVPMWFTVIVLMGISVVESVRMLRLLDPDNPSTDSFLGRDLRARESARLGVVFNILGLVTGMVWSRVAWAEDRPAAELSTWWVWDPIQVCALIALLIYAAYFLLRSSFTEPEQRAKISAVYNIFAFATLIPLFFVIPRMYEGLHPTAGKGSFIFDKSQISDEFRVILYPGMVGFILLSVWAYSVRTRLELVKLRLEEWYAEKMYREEQAG